MFVRKKPLYGGKIAVQICESYREQGRVRQRVLKHVGNAERKDLETLTKLIETSAFIRKELEDQKEKTALEIAPDLPISIPKITSIPPSQPTIEKVYPPKEEDHWVNTT